jgi:WD40 repeat protein
MEFSCVNKSCHLTNDSSFKPKPRAECCVTFNLPKITVDTTSKLISESWLKPMLDLIGERDFKEAWALAEYFPSTHSRKLVQLAALLGQNSVGEASALLSSLNSETQNLVGDFTSILSHTDVDVLTAASQAIHNKYFELGDFCIQLRLYNNPEATSVVIDWLLKIVAWRLSTGDFNIGVTYLAKAVILDDSPSRLIQYADILLVNQPEVSCHVQSVAFSPDGQFIVSGSNDKTVRLWDLNGNQIGQPFIGHNWWVRSVAFSPDGQFIVSGSNDETVRLWDLNGNQIGQPFIGHKDQVCSVTFSPDGQFIVSGSNDKTVRLWDLNGNQIGQPFIGHNWRVRSVAFSPDGQFIVSGSDDRTVRLWNLKGGQIGQPLIWYNVRVRSVAFSPDGRFIVSGSNDKTIQIWNLQGDSIIKKNPNLQIALASNLIHLSQNDIDIRPKILELFTGYSYKKQIDSGDNVLADLYAVPALRAHSIRKAYSFIPSCVDSVEKSCSDEKPKTVEIVRNTRIEFTSECVLAQPVELKIQLTREISENTRVLEKILLLIAPDTKQIELNVNVTAPGFAMRSYPQPLTLPVKGDSNEVTFTLYPEEKGDQNVEIEFFEGATRVGYVLVGTYVSSYSFFESRSEVEVLSMEDPINGLNNLLVRPVNTDKHIIHITWIEKESKLSYTIYPANRLNDWEKTIPNIQQQIEDDLRNLNAFLTEVVQQGNPSDDRWDSICFNLQGVGANLFKMLIPPEVARQVRTWKIGSTVIVSTNEQWIPWELMYDGEDFFGKKFIFARYPRLTEDEKWPDKDRDESQGDRQIKRVLNVVGGDVPASESDRATQLFSTYLPLDYTQLLFKQPISALVKALPGADVLHFTCHGHLEPHLLQIAGDKNKTRIENLLPETIQSLPLELGSLVFANACASTAPILTFGKFSSFGWKFYQRGAAAFVGTLGAVPVRYAVNFAESVYLELFNTNERISIGQAVAKAKEVAASDRNLFWLLYCIYGDPDFSFERQKKSEEEDNDN